MSFFWAYRQKTYRTSLAPYMTVHTHLVTSWAGNLLMYTHCRIHHLWGSIIVSRKLKFGLCDGREDGEYHNVGLGEYIKHSKRRMSFSLEIYM